jgi:hypothetical protein
MPPNFDVDTLSYSSNVGGSPGLPCSRSGSSIGADLAALIEIRDVALRAYLKALKAGKEYQAEGMEIKRYDLDMLKRHYIDARDLVNGVLDTGTLSTMKYRRIIPLDL